MSKFDAYKLLATGIARETIFTITDQ